MAHGAILSQNERIIRALKMFEERLRLGGNGTKAEIARRFNVDRGTVRADLQLLEDLGYLDVARKAAVDKLLPKAQSFYEKQLADANPELTPKDKDRQERLARDVMFGLNVFQKKSGNASEPPSAGGDLTLEVWRAQYKQRLAENEANSIVEGDVDIVSDQSLMLGDTDASQ